MSTMDTRLTPRCAERHRYVDNLDVLLVVLEGIHTVGADLEAQIRPGARGGLAYGLGTAAV